MSRHSPEQEKKPVLPAGHTVRPVDLAWLLTLDPLGWACWEKGDQGRGR